jgi:hypothetical protein
MTSNCNGRSKLNPDMYWNFVMSAESAKQALMETKQHPSVAIGLLKAMRYGELR